MKMTNKEGSAAAAVDHVMMHHRELHEVVQYQTTTHGVSETL